MAACSSTQADSPSPAAPEVVDVVPADESALDECSTPNLTVVNPGQVTIGAREVDVPPLFVDGDPYTGEGFEAALGYAVAETLGFADSDVAWIVLEDGDDPFGAGPRVDFVMGQVAGMQGTAPADATVASDPYLAPATGASPYVLLFAEGNPLVSCVNGALAELDATGELTALADEWLAGTPWEGSRVGGAARVS